MSPSPFLPKVIHNYYRGKVSQKIKLLQQLKKLPKENNRRLGENSPNLATLLVAYIKTDI
jgi:hypothetical protein